MKLLEEILETCTGDVPARRVAVGVFATLAEGEHAGLSSTFRAPCPDHGHTGMEGAGKLDGMSLRELAKRSLSPRLLEASLGMAALNALIPVPAKNLADRNAQELILERGRDGTVAIVGQFPFVKSLKTEVRRLEIIHETPDRGEQGVDRAREIFPEAGVIAITGSAFINHSIETLISLARHAYVLVLGATSPFSPVLFDYGVDAVCGTIVTDPDEAMSGLVQGAPFRTLGGIRRVTWTK